QVIIRALSFDPQGRHLRARDFGEELAGALTVIAKSLASSSETRPELEPLSPATPTDHYQTSILDQAPSRPPLRVAALRMALLYKRHAQPDEQLLKWLETQLAAQGHQVFVDRHLTIGVEWAKE